MRATPDNPRSGSSHIVYQFLIEKVVETGELKECQRSKVNFVDLAGYGHLKNTVDLDENRHINKSLTALGRLIECIAGKEKPAYRETLLTAVLKDCLNS